MKKKICEWEIGMWRKVPIYKDWESRTKIIRKIKLIM